MFAAELIKRLFCGFMGDEESPVELSPQSVSPSLILDALEQILKDKETDWAFVSALADLVARYRGATLGEIRAAFEFKINASLESGNIPGAINTLESLDAHLVSMSMSEMIAWKCVIATRNRLAKLKKGLQLAKSASC